MDDLMNTMPPGGGKPVRMSSREIAELTGKRHDNVVADIKKMLAELGEDVLKFQGIYRDSMNREQTEYLLDRDHTETLLLGYSAELRLRVIRRMREMEQALAEPQMPTTAEAFANAFRMLADAERRHMQQNVAIAEIRADVQEMRQSLTILDKVPANGELVTHLRDRIRKETGLSYEVINIVLDRSPYSLSPKFAVRNTHENAAGSVNHGYLKREVNAVFRAFIDQCRQVTPTLCEHDLIDFRFKLVKGGAK